MQARADLIQDIRTGNLAKADDLKKTVKALRKRPKLASPKLPPLRKSER